MSITINAKLKVPWGSDDSDYFTLDFARFAEGIIGVDSTPNTSSVSRVKVIKLQGDTPTVIEEDQGIQAEAIIKVLQKPSADVTASVEI